MNRRKPKAKAPPVPAPEQQHQTAQWPLGTYNPKEQSFEQFAKENFVPGTSTSFVRKELKKPLLVYTPEKEKYDVIRVWRVLIRYMGDIVDYRGNLPRDSYQPELGSVMTRLCRQLGQNTSDNPFGPAPASNGELVLNNDEEDLQQLPKNPKLGTLRKLKNTIALRLFGKGSRKTVFHLLPLEETLLTPLEKIQYIIGYGILRPRIRDELYCGLCRQLTDNPYKESTERGWVLMNLMTASFVPSERCLGSIMHFLSNGPKIYAATAKRSFQRTIMNGGRLHPPSKLEYEAVKNRTPLELDINLTDGSVMSFPADGTTSSGEICQAINIKLGIVNGFGFHLFIANRNKVSSLGINDHILDSLSQLEQISRDYSLSEEDSAWQLYFRKEVFEPWSDYRSDAVATNLIYAQLKRGILLEEYTCPNDSDLATLLAKICYIEKGAELDTEYLQKEILPKLFWHMPATSEDGDETLTEANDDDIHDYENIQERRHKNEQTFTDNMTQSIQEAFDSLYKDLENKPNSFNVKLELISHARRAWVKSFCRTYDITVVLDTGDLMDGVMRICVHNKGVALLGDGDLFVDDIGFVEIIQLAEEKNEDELTPHSVVLKLLNGREIVIVSQDAVDIKEILAYLLLGLTERSNFAVAVKDNTSSKVDDLDLEIGDLLLLDKTNDNNNQSQPIKKGLIKAKNKRTGQTGLIHEGMFQILPTIETPEQRILDSYKERGDWIAE